MDINLDVLFHWMAPESHTDYNDSSILILALKTSFSTSGVTFGVK